MLVGQGFEFQLHVAQVVEDRHALGKDAAAGEREAVLRKISGGSALGDDERAIVEGVHAGEDLEQRGLAGPIAADQPDVLAGVISQSTFSKRSLWPKRFPAPESWIMQLLSYQAVRQASGHGRWSLNLEVEHLRIQRPMSSRRSAQRSGGTLRNQDFGCAGAKIA